MTKVNDVVLSDTARYYGQQETEERVHRDCIEKSEVLERLEWLEMKLDDAETKEDLMCFIENFIYNLQNECNR